MYKYTSEVELLIKDLTETYEIKEKTLPFYKSRINKFFIEYMGLQNNKDKPLNAITYYDIDYYIKNLKYSDAEKVNHYNALKRFFEYTYLRGKTNEIMSHVEKPSYAKKQKEILQEDDYVKLKKFIVCRDNNINERLVLGLFLFTGLSRQYIASIRNNQFVYEEGVYKLYVWQEENEVKLPLKSELQILIHEYCVGIAADKILDKFMQIDENYISTYVGNLTKTIFGKRITPTILSNTFISKALSNGNYIWEVSKLTLESVTTIENHKRDIENLVNRQTSILNSF